ncbi:helix-turn-helix domain-containing protein [Lactobacillus johnsonii]|uniref:helix-turn-helix domain-containing protein n=1 Tax=Lactobacillus johnsonii TaxID=33959 RepID=UPI003CFCFDB5
MDSLHFTMNQHVKGKHLSFEERVIIQLRLKDGYSLRSLISLGRSSILRPNFFLFL